MDPEVEKILFAYVNYMEKPKIVILMPDIDEKDPDDPLIYMAKAAMRIGNDVEILTTHCSQTFMKKEIGYLTVRQIGNFIPNNILGWGFSFMYNIRTLYMLLWLNIMKNYLKPSFIITRESIVFLPFFKLLRKFEVIQMYKFDESELLLACSPGMLKKRNSLHNICMSYADKIIVCNKLSRTIFMNVFAVENKNPLVLYPCTMGTAFEEGPTTNIKNIINIRSDSILLVCFGKMHSSSNFELCIQAFSMVLEDLRRTEGYLYFNTFLVIASQYEFTKEHDDYYKQLKCFAQNICSNKASVIFLEDVPPYFKKTLISKCDAVLFPMVCFNARTILEAGVMKKPVIAINAGIADELIFNGMNGFLVAPNPMDFAKCMGSLLSNRHLSAFWSEEIYIFVQKKFGLDQYYKNFIHLVAEQFIPSDSKH